MALFVGERLKTARDWLLGTDVAEIDPDKIDQTVLALLASRCMTASERVNQGQGKLDHRSGS